MSYKPPAPLAGQKPQYAFIGKNFPVKDALAKVTGEAVYCGDMLLPGMLHAAILTSPHAHAIIRSIDTAEAENMPGVHCVLTCRNTPRVKYNSSKRFKGHVVEEDEQIFPETVRYHGDRVAAVAADTFEIAQEALSRIKVDYEVLPFVLTGDDALAEGAPMVHEKGNILGEVKRDIGTLETGLKGAEVVISREFTVPAINPFALEPHVTLAHWNGRRLQIWTTSQNIFAFRLILSDILQLPMNRIRLVKPTLGGGFGGKLEMVQEPVAALLTMRTGRPVRLEYTREQCFTSTRTRHASKVKITLGAKKDGTLTALSYEEILNSGAYAGSSVNVMSAQSGKAFILYNVPHMRFRGTAVYTNTLISGAMRGYGTQQIVTPLEMTMDELALELKMDAGELRLKNLYRPYDKHPSGNGTVGNCYVSQCLQEGESMIGWSKPLPAAKDGKLYGRGMCCGVHGNSLAPITIDCSTTSIKILEDGGLIVFCGNQDLGQGTVTMMSQIIAEVLGVNPERMEFIEADTDATSYDYGTFASRCTWVGGRSAKVAAEKLAAELRIEAAKMMNVDGAELVFRNGRVEHRYDPHYTATLGDVALYAQQVTRRGDMLVTGEYTSPCNVGSYGVHFAEVEVDARTGDVKVLRMVAVHDVGTPINVMNLEGQVEGGIHMGLGYALREEVLFDRQTGRMLNASAKKYKLFRAKEMPQIESRFIGGGESPGPYGAKSVGEIATVPVAGAILNAVCNAVGARIYSLPAHPEDVRAALWQSGRLAE